MNDTTEIALILDQSGSMESIKAGTLEGVNSFLLQQRTENDDHPVRLSLTLFSTGLELRHQSAPVTEIPDLNDATYDPAGGTALLDAIGTTVDGLGKRLAELPEDQRPGSVIVAIMTDGEENSSRRYTWHRISDMIRHQTEVYKWEFLFLGANQDAIATAARMNIVRENSATYVQSDGSSMSALRAVSKSVSYHKRLRARAVSEPKKSLTALFEEEEAQSKPKK